MAIAYEELREYFADYLWGMFALETIAVAVVDRVSKSTLFTSEERDVASDLVLPDEVRHVRMIKHMAESVGQPKHWPLIQIEPFDHLNEIQMLTKLHVGERDFLRNFDHVTKAFISCNNSSDMWLDLLMIKNDESAHIDWGRKIFSRLHKEGFKREKMEHPNARAVQDRLKMLLSKLVMYEEG